MDWTTITYDRELGISSKPTTSISATSEELLTRPTQFGAVVKGYARPESAANLASDLVARVGLSRHPRAQHSLSVVSYGRTQAGGPGASAITTDEYHSAAEAADPAVTASEFVRRFGHDWSWAPVLTSNGRKHAWLCAREWPDGAGFKIHTDSFPELHIAPVVSAVLVCALPPLGGQIEVYAEAGIPSEADMESRRDGPLGVRGEGLGAPVELTAEVGDLVLLNPAYYHRVTAVRGGVRQTLGFFVGLRDGRPYRFH